MTQSFDIASAQSAHLNFLLGSFISKIEKLPDFTWVYSDIISDSYWNYVTDVHDAAGGDRHFFQQIEDKFRKSARTPCVLVDRQTQSTRASLLQRNGFKPCYADAWMIFEGALPPPCQSSSNIQIRRCDCKEDFRLYLDTFFASYSGASPEEPYGALPRSYGEAFERAFALREARGLHFYLATEGNTTVGIAMLGKQSQAACLYGLGVKPEHRKRGIGEALTHRRLTDTLENGPVPVFLQTEDGSYNQQLFSKFGFRTYAVFDAYTL